MSLEVQHCRSCQAPIYWLKNRSTGKKAPIDAAPDESGNCVVYPDGTYFVLRKTDTVVDFNHLHTNHFQTCPQSKTWAGKAEK